MHALHSDGCGQFAKHIPLGAHLACAPIGQVRLVHGETVVMFGHRYDVTCAGVMKKLCPYSGIEALGREFRYQVFITKLRLWTVSGDLVCEVGRALLVHVARVPLTAESGD